MIFQRSLAVHLTSGAPPALPVLRHTATAHDSTAPWPRHQAPVGFRSNFPRQCHRTLKARGEPCTTLPSVSFSPSAHQRQASHYSISAWPPPGNKSRTCHGLPSCRHFASHRIASHRIAPHRTASHRIAPHRTASHRNPSQPISIHRRWRTATSASPSGGGFLEIRPRIDLGVDVAACLRGVHFGSGVVSAKQRDCGLDCPAGAALSACMGVMHAHVSVRPGGQTQIK